MENFKRPNHTDFMDTSELRKIEYSGIRSNSISQDIEIWVLGEIKERVRVSQLHLNPRAVDEALQRVFALENVDVKQLKGN